MSRSVDLFIHSDASLEELAGLIVARTGLTVSPASDTAGAGIALGDGDLVARLDEHAYVDDAELTLSRYRYVLSLRTIVPGHLGGSLEASFLRHVAEALDDHPTFLVLDLQYRDRADGDGPDDAEEDA
jgi:hypothetical protein